MSDVDGVAVNEVGDVVLSDGPTIEALADRSRFRLFAHLQRNGPLREDALEDALGIAAAALRADLRRLRAVGLVTDSPTGWTALGRGLYVDSVPPEAEAAVRRLYEVMILDTADLPGRWVREGAGRLDDDWFRSSGMFNARVCVTRAELDDLQVKLEELLGPYFTRGELPEDARQVRVLAYFMAEPA